MPHSLFKERLKKAAGTIFGAAAFLSGASGVLLVIVVVARGGVGTVPLIFKLLCLLVISVCLVVLGLSGLRSVFLNQGQKELRVIWWKVALGVMLVTMDLNTFIAPGPNLLKPSNSGEVFGMKLTAITIMLLGIWLVVAGVRGKFPKV